MREHKFLDLDHCKNNFWLLERSNERLQKENNDLRWRLQKLERQIKSLKGISNIEGSLNDYSRDELREKLYWLNVIYEKMLRESGEKEWIK